MINRNSRETGCDSKARSFSVLAHFQHAKPGFAAGRNGKGLLRRFKVRIHAVDSTVIQLVANSMDWPNTAVARPPPRCICGSISTASCPPSPLWTPPVVTTTNAPANRGRRDRRVRQDLRRLRSTFSYGGIGWRVSWTGRRTLVTATGTQEAVLTAIILCRRPIWLGPSDSGVKCCRGYSPRKHLGRELSSLPGGS